MAPTLLLIGSGPGIGLTTATLFAAKKFSKVALLSRNKDRLVADRETLLSSLPAVKNVEVKTWAVDIVDEEKYKKVLKEVEEWSVDVVDCVIFNAARIVPSPLLEFPAEEIVNDFMVRLSFHGFGWLRLTRLAYEHCALHYGSMGHASAVQHEEGQKTLFLSD
jgi:short-subunit dehydrogenase